MTTNSLEFGAQLDCHGVRLWPVAYTEPSFRFVSDILQQHLDQSYRNDGEDSQPGNNIHNNEGDSNATHVPHLGEMMPDDPQPTRREDIEYDSLYENTPEPRNRSKRARSSSSQNSRQLSTGDAQLDLAARNPSLRSSGYEAPSLIANLKPNPGILSTLERGAPSLLDSASHTIAPPSLSGHAKTSAPSNDAHNRRMFEEHFGHYADSFVATLPAEDAHLMPKFRWDALKFILDTYPGARSDVDVFVKILDQTAREALSSAESLVNMSATHANTLEMPTVAAVSAIEQDIPPVSNTTCGQPLPPPIQTPTGSPVYRPRTACVDCRKKHLECTYRDAGMERCLFCRGNLKKCVRPEIEEDECDSLDSLYTSECDSDESYQNRAPGPEQRIQTGKHQVTQAPNTGTKIVSILDDLSSNARSSIVPNKCTFGDGASLRTITDDAPMGTAHREGPQPLISEPSQDEGIHPVLAAGTSTQNTKTRMALEEDGRDEIYFGRLVHNIWRLRDKHKLLVSEYMDCTQARHDSKGSIDESLRRQSENRAMVDEAQRDAQHTCELADVEAAKAEAVIKAAHEKVAAARQLAHNALVQVNVLELKTRVFCHEISKARAKHDEMEVACTSLREQMDKITGEVRAIREILDVD